MARGNSVRTCAVLLFVVAALVSVGQTDAKRKGVCSQPKKVGRCRASMPRFYFDREQKACLGFNFGGCRPNGNNFLSQEDCERTCIQSVDNNNNNNTNESNNDPSNNENGPDNTNQNRPARPIKNNKNRPGRFNNRPNKNNQRRPNRPRKNNQNRPSRPDSNNQNRPSRPDSNNQTRPSRPDSNNQNRPSRPDTNNQNRPSRPDRNNQNKPNRPHNNNKGQNDANVCNLPSETGPCPAHRTMYYFDATSGQCHTFVYGGCRGNRNRFPDEASCMARCGSGNDQGATVEIRPNAV